MAYREKTEFELDESDARDYIRSFIRVQANSWIRRQFNEIYPKVESAMTEAALRGEQVDLPKLLAQIWVEQELPRIQ